jgi:predicted kinase
MNKMYCTFGIPASGKTTWAENFSKSFNIPNINLDDLRVEFYAGTYGTPEFKFDKKLEKEILLKQAQLVTETRGSVIISDTNLNPKTIARLKRLASQTNREIVWISFAGIDPETCKRRNKGRPLAVPEHVIDRMYVQLQEGLDNSWWGKF